ncbi:MAG: M1 family aminopeptidase [Bacteroidetes bacterium]|nr:M1 family aminopeptidase [Bacteroidota bacterium]
MFRKSLLLFFLFLLCKFLPAEDLRCDTIDIRSYQINIDLSDFATKILYADVTIGMKAKINNVQNVRLDLLGLTIDTVRVNGYNVPFDYNDSVLNINTLSFFNNGDSFTVRVVYHGHPLQMANDIGGFYWTATYAYNIGASYLSNPHNYGKVWFPCFDNFRERSVYEFYVTTKNTHEAFCNGLLQGFTSAANKKTWHWKLNEEIPSYLASVAISDYQTLTDTVNGIGGVIEIDLAARAVDTTALKNLFVHLHNAFHIFENLWGEYKWDKIGYCIVPFTGGAIEHATNIAFSQYYLSQLSADCETAMAHELSHHWFGDLVTCNSASEMWLNEGWARYNEKQFLEKLYGDSTYKSSMRINHEDVLHRAHILDDSYLPVSGVPTEYTYGKTVYDKGADALHTLRHYMNDATFFNCVKNYVRDFSWQNTSTAQFRDYLSQCAGVNLNDCFNDWFNAPGFPHFSIEGLNVHQNGITVIADMVIRQQLLHAPHYYNLVPVSITYFDYNFNRIDEIVFVSGACTPHSRSFNNFTPAFIALDFHEHLQDAITDEWKVITDTGAYDFGTAKMILNVNANTDSSLVRIEHNWIRPEPMQNKIAGLHLHDKRYWTVDGIFNAGFKTDGQISFNGTDSLDAAFFINNEDSLVVMYRASSAIEWAFADSFAINTQGSSTNKTGYATIYNLKKGQYCFAIWNSSVPDSTTAETDCVFSSVDEIEEQNNFELFPNPTSESLNLSFYKNIFSRAEVYDLAGRKLWEQKIAVEQNSLQLNLKNFAEGTYIVTLFENDGRRMSKKLVKQ